jgi:hypothetical protein
MGKCPRFLRQSLRSCAIAAASFCDAGTKDRAESAAEGNAQKTTKSTNKPLTK